MKTVIKLSILLATLCCYSLAWSWDPREVGKLEKSAGEARAALLEKDPSMQKFFDSAVGWVIIPTVGKAGVGIGGAYGKGLLYKGGKAVAIASMAQMTIGFQWGGQAYSEFIFFRDQAALERFEAGNFELGAQASAIAVTVGASVDAGYTNGIAIFTQAKGGLMYEASVGGQKFKVEPID